MFEDADPDLLPEGLSDRMPPLAAEAMRVTRAMTDALAGHGYDPVQPPMVEFERSLASRMAGTQRKRMARFVDPASLRTLAMRCDMTVQVGRIAATTLKDAPRPLRLSYAGQVLLLKGEGLEPERERLQVGAEVIGSDTVAAASESVAVAIAALRAAGAGEISVDFTLPDLVDTLAASAMPLAPDAIPAVRRELDAKDAGGLSAVGGDAYLPLLYATGPFETAIEKFAAIDAGGALKSRIDALRQIAASVGDSARVTLDPTERHGFEYQSWFGFTIYAKGVRGALGRGGTYRITSEAGHDEVATGFSLYPDPLIALGAGSGKSDRLFLPLGHDRDAAARLRTIGWQTLAALGEGDDPRALGCTHVLNGAEPSALA
ncbi:ATP phosphoribosyltransferase regulatory subunit [Croceicoccus naphthovorans]|uniref:tRNA synthetase class II n=1 Tax=Croceicoccus naphthovorans TaxID=1348774 RepID=A0A0G3XG37_9SPHN|nr:ATP phosphoribosyltransferase regulatory subunit [Croceicoccus naphthovorans]AKM09358.1 tRNA synthetase class II [Croceicoccus naphthovorans]MBB3990274.1 ATP phosphoribosyltransferase regulatory subunit [Croceicoccus naphthovorans]